MTMQNQTPSDADREQPIRELAELVAADEAQALRFVFAKVDAGELTEEEGGQLCEEVEAFAARHNIDLSRGLSCQWLVEFPARAGLAGAIVSANDAADAEVEAIAFSTAPATRVRQI